jgi:hypothetical protein
MPQPETPSSSQTRSFKLAWSLFLAGLLFLALFAVWPHSSAEYIVPAFLLIHGIVCVWASQEAFAGTGPASGCMPGIILWIVFSLELMLLGGIWLTAVGGPH